MLKLGKKPVKHDDRTLIFGKYLNTAALPTIPQAQSWDSKVTSWPMMANDQLGDCTIACVGHLIELWTTYSGTQAVVPDADIIAAYSAVSGYDPSTGEGDEGAAILDVLNYWRDTGIGGHKVDAFAAVENEDLQHTIAGIYLFGGVNIGVQLPLSAEKQIGQVWQVTKGLRSRPGSWGGHCVPIVDYDIPNNTLTCVTWGALQKMTVQFFHKYCDEVYVPLSQDWFNQQNLSPGSFDFAALQADLAGL